MSQLPYLKSLYGIRIADIKMNTNFTAPWYYINTRGADFTFKKENLKL